MITHDLLCIKVYKNKFSYQNRHDYNFSNISTHRFNAILLIINMKLLILLSIFCVFLLNVKAEEDWTELTDSSKLLGYCYSDTDGLGALKKGERKRLKSKCVQAECNEGGLITFTGCHLGEGDPLCRVGKPHLQYPFPDCCPEVMCT